MLSFGCNWPERLFLGSDNTQVAVEQLILWVVVCQEPDHGDAFLHGVGKRFHQFVYFLWRCVGCFLDCVLDGIEFVIRQARTIFSQTHITASAVGRLLFAKIIQQHAATATFVLLYIFEHTLDTTFESLFAFFVSTLRITTYLRSSRVWVKTTRGVFL